MYVLAQGIKTGVYRVCDELFPLLARSDQFDPRLYYRAGDDKKPSVAAIHRLLGAPTHEAPADTPSADADILLSPFGVAPAEWLRDPQVLQAHIVYDLIGIRHPEYFSEQSAAEVRRIMDSLDEHTVVFAISEYTRNDLLAYRSDLSPSQVTVIPLAAGAAFRPCDAVEQRRAVRTKYGIPLDVPYVLSLATLEIRKNLDQIVRAFLLHLEQQPQSELHLVLSGMSGWKLERLQGALSSAGHWRHRIVLTGFVDDDDLSALYSDALCFIYLSRYEGFGLPPLEAMACGTPVICADNSSLPEVVGKAGLLLNADDAQGVAAALQKIAESPELRQQLADAGLKRAKVFSWERCAEIIVETLSSAYALHERRPIGRRPRDLASPGGQVPGAKQVNGVAEASLLGFQNGSQGRRFPASDPMRSASAAWPVWVDRLPDNGGRIVEGGLRTEGRHKSSTDGQPLVSYITVVRNNAVTLARTLDSVQRQTYPNVEHIVLDGASTDGTLDLIRQHAGNLDYFVSEPDTGLYAAINKAIQLARGQLICILNSDDWLEPRAAEIAVHRMSGRTDAALLLTTALVAAEPEKVREWCPSVVHPGCYFTCADDCHNGIYANRAAYEQAGPYDASYKIVADFKWLMTCLEADVGFVYTREATVNYSMGGISGDIRQHSIECIRVVRERFPFLSAIEASGLYHCFFKLGGAVRALEEDRPVDLTEFVRSMFTVHQDQADFVRALTWAAMARLRHPAEFTRPVAALPPPPPLPSTGRALKDLVKSVLRRYPRLYGLAVRGYVRLRA
ncbi:glycosyltransferase [Variovorax sp. PAMC28562]|uniref:glycosyltransferase n=1 Tax=Variovorax sp. PAMC28562 TaxID=2762323 RepID=UPI00164D0347|nr:glycosyltransferase [Variovorax sp. PAMC28562]QNK75213.1 glycosyltransferase [Variovorax sp. PAMC28562]